MYPFYLGIDLHLKNSYVVLMRNDGQIIDQRKLTNEEMSEYLERKVPYETHAVLEATRNWAWLYDLLTDRVAKVDLAHPKELRMIAQAAVKTDQIDSSVLAHLARTNFLPTAYAAPKTVRDLRTSMRQRDAFVRMRTKAKNRIHAVLAQYNLRSPMSDLFGVQGKEYLRTIEDHMRPASVFVVQQDLTLIGVLDNLVKELEAHVELTPEQKQGVKLLETLPGIGPVLALVVMAEIGSIERFHSSKALCNYAGLTPRVRQSDSITRRGHISKQGSPYLRAAFTRAASLASRYSPRWRAVHTKMLNRTGKIGAKVAVARRLLAVAYHVLKNQTPYKEDYQTSTSDR